MKQHLMILFIVFIASCSQIPVGQEAPEEYLTCTTDADCVPRPGCHPETCINSAYEDKFETPDLCTLMYMCGTASDESCLCQNNRCVNSITPESDPACAE